MKSPLYSKNGYTTLAQMLNPRRNEKNEENQGRSARSDPSCTSFLRGLYQSSLFRFTWRGPLCAAIVWLACLGAGPWRQPDAQAQTVAKPPAQPVLRIETGMHTSVVWRMGVDAAGRFLVTGSEDKTVRVWELATGRLLRTLRPPIGAGNEGKIFAVAISPDGSLIAAGGWTGFEWDKQYRIYLFDRESGRIALRLGGALTVVNHLAFSPDGTRLAAALGAGAGIRVFRVSDGGEIGRDTDCGAVSLGLDFDRAGRLVTGCWDGQLRLYDRNLTLLKKVRAPSGQRPIAVRFAPDGAKVAVGYSDSERVDVLDSNSLEGLYRPDTTGVSNGNLGVVAWSADGSALYAGGGWIGRPGINFIRRWTDAGRGRYQDLAAAGNRIMDLAPLPDGGVVFGTGAPAWGVFSATGERVRLVAGEIADYRDNKEGFLTDAAGGVVGFGYEPFGQSPARFSLAERRLETGASVGASLRPPRINGLAITDWKYSDAPKLNGVNLPLNQHEKSRSLAIAPDAQSFLLGADFYLRLFDRSGKQQWRAAIPDLTLSVNISGDGKLALAAFGDGTIRWYRMTDGKELLAFFPHKDRKRWVLWTPGGNYDCSPGAEELIGWHINNGKDQAADFFPAGRFRGIYYRPDVISRVLAVGDEAIALRQADEEAGRRRQESDLKKRLPPVINILSPTDGSEISTATFSVRYSLRSPSGEPVTGVKVLIDGRPASAERGVGARLQNNQTGELTVSVPQRDCELGLVAENQYASSVASVVRLRWRGATEADLIKPKLYILAVGVAQYRDPSWNLNYPAKDARDFVAAMRLQEGGLYRQVEVRLLTDQQATKDNILDGLEWIQRQTTSRDVAMVFFAGHGVNDNLNRYFFCSHNFEEQSLMRTGVAYSDIKSTVEAIAGKALFFVDTCHAGNAIGGRRRGGAVDIIGLVNDLSSVENGVVVFTAATGKQNSLEDAKWGNGAFTKALVEGLTGRADVKNLGKITVSMLDFYVAERVKELTGGRQTPATVKPETVPDFPIAIRK
jgi:WD40 repeat protein